jgi:hypothetical protein
VHGLTSASIHSGHSINVRFPPIADIRSSAQQPVSAIYSTGWAYLGSRVAPKEGTPVAYRLLNAAFGMAIAGAVPLAASAHHSPAMFDQTKTIWLTGTVRQFQFTNPHVYIQLSIEEKGVATEWSLELGAPIYLRNKGWTRSTLKAGDQVSIRANPLRSGAKGGLALEVVRRDGRALGRIR